MSMGPTMLVPQTILTSLANTTTMTQAGLRAHPFGDHPKLRRGHHCIGSGHPRETPGALVLLLALRWHRKVAMRIAARRSHFPASAAPRTWPFHGSLGAVGEIVGYDPQCKYLKLPCRRGRRATELANRQSLGTAPLPSLDLHRAVQERANASNGAVSWPSAARSASMYRRRASPGSLGVLRPQAKRDSPMWTISRSAARRENLPFPLGNG